jgi:hypothetical protein
MSIADWVTGIFLKTPVGYAETDIDDTLPQVVKN